MWKHQIERSKIFTEEMKMQMELQMEILSWKQAT